MPDTSRITDSEVICYAVEQVLVETYLVDHTKARHMVLNSSFYDTLQEDIDFIEHKDAFYWAKYILEEYDIPH